MEPTIVGEMKEREELFHVFEWQILDFASMPAEVDEEVQSPSFNFAGERWEFVMYPNGSKDEDSEGYIGIYLQRELSGFVSELKFTLGLKTSNSEIAEEVHCTNDFDTEFPSYGWPCFLKRSKLLEKSSELVPSGHLTWICRMKQSKSIYASNLESLCQDFKKVLLDGSNHDLILKVGDTEFRAHRDILKARSQVFYSMLSHDMVEKNSEAIKIPDCDPEAMKLFLMHVYCGQVEGLDENNMLGLYYLADKYDMKYLKEECHNFIKKSLSVTNFCYIIQLALNHSDSSLLEYAKEYFSCNTLDILETVEWQSFMKTNSTVANELFIKSYKQKW